MNLEPTYIALPVPPSLNSKLGINWQQRRVFTNPAVKEWEMQAKAMMRQQAPEPIEGPFLALFNMERPNKLSDTDNRMKLTLDFLHRQGITPDDRHNSGFSVAWMPNATGRIFIALFPTQLTEIEFRPHKAHPELGAWYFSRSTQ